MRLCPLLAAVVLGLNSVKALRNLGMTGIAIARLLTIPGYLSYPLIVYRLDTKSN